MNLMQGKDVEVYVGGVEIKGYVADTVIWDEFDSDEPEVVIVESDHDAGTYAAQTCRRAGLTNKIILITGVCSLPADVLVEYRNDYEVLETLLKQKEIPSIQPPQHVGRKRGKGKRTKQWER